MAKIKGWTKLSEREFSSESTIAIYQEIGKERGIIIRYNYPNGIEVDINGVSKLFKTKQQALDYAIKYMRSHPNG
jgi:hypothetical protein